MSVEQLDAEKAARYAARMARKKAIIDKKIASADQDTGLLLVLTGNGKGKSSSAFGMVARALGHGLNVGVVQFIKGRTDTGEEAFFSKQAGVEWHVMGDGFTWETQNLAQDKAKAEAAWELAKKILQSDQYDLVVLDELTYCIQYGFLDAQVVRSDLLSRPEMQHVVVTGRGAQPILIEIADTVTEMSAEKHAYEAGIRAQKGVEW